MALFLLDDATGIGSNDLDTLQAFVDLVIIANDDGVGLDDPAGGRQRVTYTRTENGPPQLRLDALTNTAFTPDYGLGAGPQNVDTVVIAGLSGFTLDDGTSFANNGTALPPSNSGLAGAGLNTTQNCLVIYDTQQNICVARDGTGGDIDLPISNPVVLFHEFSHAFRIVTNALLALTGECDPSSPEENAAIVDENDLRTQIANRQGETPVLRDPGNHCGSVGCDGGCCIIATLVTRSSRSPQVQSLRCVRDNFVRRTEVGHAFFERFHRDYYGFSPQVCTILAGHQDLTAHLLDGYVEPLLDFWRMMIERSEGVLERADLVRAFVTFDGDRVRAERRREALRTTIERWLDPSGDAASSAPADLISLLQERAWPSEHIQWALVAPVRITAELLGAHFDGATDEQLGVELERLLDAWAAEVPLSDVWAALPVDRLVEELAFCDDVLLQSNTARDRFRRRLAQRFGDITSVAAVVGHEVAGGAER